MSKFAWALFACALSIVTFAMSYVYQRKLEQKIEAYLAHQRLEQSEVITKQWAGPMAHQYRLIVYRPGEWFSDNDVKAMQCGSTLLGRIPECAVLVEVPKP